MGKGTWAALIVGVAVVCSPMAQAHFLSPDSKAPKPGDVFGFNRYTYANNNPVMHVDPDGRDCTTTNRTTTCFTAFYRVSFAAQPGFQDFTTGSPNYHFLQRPGGYAEYDVDPRPEFFGQESNPWTFQWGIAPRHPKRCHATPWERYYNQIKSRDVVLPN